MKSDIAPNSCGINVDRPTSYDTVAKRGVAKKGPIVRYKATVKK